VRRIALWLSSTAVLVALLFGYHTSTSGALDAADTPPAITGGTVGAGSGASGTTGGTTVTGDSVPTQWGPVQVELTMTDGAIAGVDVVQYPTGNPKDEEINSRALPVLVQETLEAQSADIDMVSGATVTSQGYVASLQSAPDRA
jgi:uncharacterized protein with FMN-binding domain